MKREILLARSAAESRGAVVTDGVLSDYRMARAEAPSLAGAVYLARVRRIVPGLAGAIIEIPGGEAWLDLSRGRRSHPSEGAAIAVQILQDGQKGKLPRATPEPMITGRFLAYQPHAAKPSLSHRIVRNDERARLGALLGKLGSKPAGQFLALHRAPEANDETLLSEAERLRELWLGALPALVGAAPAHGLPPSDPVLDLLRLFVGPPLARIAVDSEALASEVRKWLALNAPEWQGAIEREPVGRTTLESADIRGALEEALSPEVALPGGGALVIEGAAGLTAIDVDTDRAAAASAKATFAAVNREAARVIARQIRLRNLGGRIVVDFAGLGASRDMDAPLDILRAAVADDPVAVQIGRPSELGLVELLRRRERRTLAEMLGHR